MNNNQLAGIVSGLGNRVARRVGGSGNRGGGTNRFDVHIAEVQAQHALRSQVIDHILGQDASERESARSNAEAELNHTHVTAQSLQVHQQQQERLQWLADNAAGSSDVHYKTAAGDEIKFKTKAGPAPAPASTTATSRSSQASRIMSDGSHLPARHRQAYVNGTRAEKVELNKKHFYNK